MIKGSNNYNILYYTGKYIFVMLLICALLSFLIGNNILISICLIPVDYLVLKICIIGTLEGTNDFKIKKADMEIPFIIATSIAIVIIGLIFHYNIFILIILFFVHAIMFKVMDANNEKRIEEANKAIDEYFLNHERSESNKKKAKKKIK